MADGLTINIEGLGQMLNELRVSERDILTGCAIGLTRTAVIAHREVVNTMKQRFDRPTPFALGSVRYTLATRERPEVIVGVRDEKLPKGGDYAEVLGHEFAGGLRKVKRFEKAMQRSGLLSRGMLATPSRGWRTDPFGNIPRARLVEILSYLDQFGEQGYRANAGPKGRARYQRKNALQFFSASKTKRETRRLPEGVWARGIDGNEGIAPVLLFAGAKPYRKRIDLPDIVLATAEQHGLTLIAQAIGQRLARYR